MTLDYKLFKVLDFNMEVEFPFSLQRTYIAVTTRR